MKLLQINKFKLFIIFCLVIVTISLSFRNTEEELVVSASINKMNILFYGIENHITIGVENTDRKEVKVSGIDVDLKPLGNGKYSVEVKGQTPQIIVKTGSTKKILEFKAKRLPDPILSWRYPQETINAIKKLEHYSIDFSEYISNYITIDKAQEFEAFDLKIEGGDFFEDIVSKNDFKIISFLVTRVTKLGEVAEIEYKVDDKATSGKVKQLINGASLGDTFYIEKVKVQNLKGEEPWKDNPFRIGSSVFKVCSAT